MDINMKYDGKRFIFGDIAFAMEGAYQKTTNTRLPPALVEMALAQATQDVALRIAKLLEVVDPESPAARKVLEKLKGDPAGTEKALTVLSQKPAEVKIYTEHYASKSVILYDGRKAVSVDTDSVAATFGEPYTYAAKVEHRSLYIPFQEIIADPAKIHKTLAQHPNVCAFWLWDDELEKKAGKLVIGATQQDRDLLQRFSEFCRSLPAGNMQGRTRHAAVTKFFENPEDAIRTARKYSSAVASRERFRQEMGAFYSSKKPAAFYGKDILVDGDYSSPLYLVTEIGEVFKTGLDRETVFRLHRRKDLKSAFTTAVAASDGSYWQVRHAALSVRPELALLMPEAAVNT